MPFYPLKSGSWRQTPNALDTLWTAPDLLGEAMFSAGEYPPVLEVAIPALGGKYLVALTDDCRNYLYRLHTIPDPENMRI